MLTFNIVTIFPKIFDSYFTNSIIQRAQTDGLVKINIHNLRDCATDKRQTVDDRPYGGGPGMILMAEPILKAVQKITKTSSPKKRKIIVLSAKGKLFTQQLAQKWSKDLNNIIFVSGRYEGIDERVKKILHAEEISIGPYVLNDGDVAIMTIISALTRLVPGVIKDISLEEESYSMSDKWLEYPQYTRPEIIAWKKKNYKVPKVLLSGNHEKINEWRI